MAWKRCGGFEVMSKLLEVSYWKLKKWMVVNEVGMMKSVGCTIDVTVEEKKKECVKSNDEVGECDKSSVHYSFC